MDFTPHSTLVDTTSNIQETSHGNLQNYPPFSIALMPCSLLVFKDTAYSGERIFKCFSIDLNKVLLPFFTFCWSDYLHGIKDCEIQQYDEVRWLENHHGIIIWLKKNKLFYFLCCLYTFFLFCFSLFRLWMVVRLKCMVRIWRWFIDLLLGFRWLVELYLRFIRICSSSETTLISFFFF